MTNKLPTLCVMIFILVAFLLVPKPSVAADCRLTILFFNDLHGYLAIPKKDLGGAARMAALAGKIEEANTQAGRYTIMLVGGDVISGTRVSEYFKGDAEIEFLKAMGTEAVVVGNHDFDFGQEFVKKMAEKLDVPVLGANIMDERTRRNYIPASYVLPLNPECKVGIMGLTMEETPLKTKQENVEGLAFLDPVKYAEYYIDDLVDQSEIKIALTHIDRAKDIEVAKKIKGLDVVIGGHDHVGPNDFCIMVGAVPVCETPPNGRYLGRIDLTYSNGKVMIEKTELIPVDKKAKKQKGVEKLLKPYLDKVAPLDNGTVGVLKKTLLHPPRPSVKLDNLLVVFVADALRDYTKSDIAVLNRSSVRRSLL